MAERSGTREEQESQPVLTVREQVALLPSTPGVYQFVNRAGEEREWTGAGNEVWSFGADNEEILVRYIHFRERMRP